MSTITLTMHYFAMFRETIGKSTEHLLLGPVRTLRKKVTVKEPSPQANAR